jgi:hypothetical protein
MHLSKDILEQSLKYKNHKFSLLLLPFSWLLKIIDMLLSDKSVGIIPLAITISLAALVIVVIWGSVIIPPPVNAQQNITSTWQSKNITTNIADAQKKKLTFWYFDKEQ